MTARNTVIQLEVPYGREMIPFALTRKARSRLTISVHPDMRVTVQAPLGKSDDHVKERVRRRAPWIAKQKRYFSGFQPLPSPRKYVSGETHCYLGRQYRLKVRKATTNSVKLVGKFLWVHTTSPKNIEKVKTHVDDWYREHARVLFARRVELCHKKAKRQGLVYPGINIRKMKTRWGSYSGNGSILLNLDLIKMPISCIDYVIMHELCHMKFQDHSRRYYDLLTKCMPDWEVRKEKLNFLAVEL